MSDISVTVVSDGSPLISYQEGTKFKVVYCADSACSDSRITIVDDGLANEIVTGSDGLGLIVYISGNPNIRDIRLLKVAHCETINCRELSSSTIEASMSGSVTIGGDGLPLIAFLSTRNELKGGSL